jgi:predicted nucleotidyltransferase
MDNHLLCNSSIELVKSIFTPSQVLFAYIAGSRAKGSFEINSDIDLFIVIDEPDYEKEKEFAEALKKLHIKYNLHFDHCGEIFSRKTIENLLNKIDNVDKLVNWGFCKLACFQSQCILSITRKTLVILSMLSHQKTHIIGDKILLAKYEKIANDFFETNSHISLSTSNAKIEWSHENNLIDRIKDKHHHFSQKIAMNDFLDTPIGIGLERYFLKDIKFDSATEIIKSDNLNLNENLCPIGNLDFSPMKSLIISQCIGFH